MGETKRLDLVIPGKPVPQARHKIARIGRHVHTYDPSYKIKACIREEIRNQSKGLYFDQGEALVAKVAFHTPIPESLNRRQKNRKIFDSSNTSKPDIDNYLKLICDCLTGVVLHDDSQIVYISATKAYSETPRTEVTIMTAPKIELSTTARAILELMGPQDLTDLRVLISSIEGPTNLFDDQSYDENTVRQRGEYLERTAEFLSVVAKKYAHKLKKIATHYPPEKLSL